MSNLIATQVGVLSAEIEDPPLGQDVYFNLQLTTRIQIIGIQFSLATDATVTNRIAALRASTGHYTFGDSVAPAVQPASQTYTYIWAPCTLGVDYAADGSVMFAPLASSLYIEPDQHIETNVINLQSGDAITNLTLRFLQALPA